jgi:hypothetical protein
MSSQKTTTATMQLSVMGYSGNILCAKFILEKIQERQVASAPVTVERTPESNKRRWQEQVWQSVFSF